jgi:putative FmdB family regulatory protein
MPLYEYECDDCGHRFELIRKFSDQPVSVCPACAGRVRKLVSSSAIQFKGTGWYVTDYARKPSGGQPASESGQSSEDRKTDSKDTSTPAGDSKKAGSKKADSAAPKASPPSPSAG